MNPLAIFERERGRERGIERWRDRERERNTRKLIKLSFQIV